MSIPKVHMAERRRLVEGKRILGEIREDEQRRVGDGDTREQADRKRGRKDWLVEKHLEKRRNGGTA